MKIEESKRNGGGLRMRNPSIFERAKILTRQTADRIIGTIDENNYYYSNTLHGTHIQNNAYDSRFVLAQLNSELLNFYYKKTTNEGGKVFAQIKIELLRLMPICFSTNQSPFINIVRYIEILTSLNHLQFEFDYFKLLLDSIVYELYFENALKA